ncbi:MAG: magnesium transporter [Caulobacteraceae bacterium]|nr:magnesium transporter [Caulobacter sp.]
MFTRKARPTDPLPADHEPRRIWIDLLNPDAADHQHAETACGLRLPDKAALSEIENSSRHYQEGEATYLSAPLMHASETDDADLTPVGFIITPEHLVTVRFEPMKAFDAAAKRLAEHPPASSLDAFTALLEEIVDRKADILEAQAAKLSTVSTRIFAHDRPHRKRRRASDEMRQTLTEVGRVGAVLGKMRSSLLTTHRITSYVQDGIARAADKDLRRRLAAADDDIQSLSGFAETLSNKVAFLLDAVLGFINIDQNDVIKVLTVVSVVGVPPTLVASWYGMNFKHMPELDWAYGYPYAFTLLVLSVVVPLVWLKVRGWF